METGKVEYAPDYKSENRNEAAIKLLDEWLSRPAVEETPEMERHRRQIHGELDSEHARLQAALVEAVKKWRCNGLANLDVFDFRYHAESMLDAVDALITFEAEHGIGVE